MGNFGTLNFDLNTADTKKGTSLTPPPQPCFLSNHALKCDARFVSYVGAQVDEIKRREEAEEKERQYRRGSKKNRESGKCSSQLFHPHGKPLP